MNMGKMYMYMYVYIHTHGIYVCHVYSYSHFHIYMYMPVRPLAFLKGPSDDEIQGGPIGARKDPSPGDVEAVGIPQGCLVGQIICTMVKTPYIQQPNIDPR